jgi:hypothetical protein
MIQVDDDEPLEEKNNDEDYSDSDLEFDDDLDDPDADENLKQARSDLVRAALETQLMEYANKRSEQKRNMEELTCHIEEFMDSFIVLGYSYEGEPLTLVSASTQQQADSLSTLLQKFIVQSGQGKGPGSIL